MATTHPSTGLCARERSRLAHRPGSTTVRLIAPGGPVSAAVIAGRGEAIEEGSEPRHGLAASIAHDIAGTAGRHARERAELAALTASIGAILGADDARLDACLAALTARRTQPEAGGCA